MRAEWGGYQFSSGSQTCKLKSSHNASPLVYQLVPALRKVAHCKYPRMVPIEVHRRPVCECKRLGIVCLCIRLVKGEREVIVSSKRGGAVNAIGIKFLSY
jgi:hypothetical protein